MKIQIGNKDAVIGNISIIVQYTYMCKGNLFKLKIVESNKRM